MAKDSFRYFFLIVLFSGCVGPLVIHEPAKTVGLSKHELLGGYGQAGYVFKWNYGLTENLDLGLHMESLSLGVRAKYAFINNNAGWSLASALGSGVSFGSKHYYGDIIGSYANNNWEPYGAFRLVHVTTDPIESKNSETGAVTFQIGKTEFDYGQITLGTRYILNEDFLISVEGSSLVSVTPGAVKSSNLIAGLAFIFKVR